MADDERNKRTLMEAVQTLGQIEAGPSTPKTVKKAIAGLVADLKGGEYSVSVRAANAISVLDDITQDPNMPSYIRTQLWQTVSRLEGIRE